MRGAIFRGALLTTVTADGLEGLASLAERRANIADGFPAADRNVDVSTINLHSGTDAPCAMSSQYRCATANKGIQNQIVALGAVTDGVGDCVRQACQNEAWSK
jgi:hypothetical protein